ncbi:MAG TPA: Ig-like domain-containing protein [Solirubrobacteraceae bacterium]|nr:Ig-like domain-containing protein [Solirubrobacteraceae bacterium]
MRSARQRRIAAAACAGLLALGGGAAVLPAAASAAETQATTTTLKSSRPEARYGDPGQITAQVKATRARAGVPSGSVEFLVDGEALTTVTLDASGRAALPLAELYPSFGVGPHAVTASYLGDATFAPSSSAPLTETLVGRTSEASATLSLNEKGAPYFSPSSFNLRYLDPFSCNVQVHNETANAYQVLYGTPGSWKALRYVIPAGGTGGFGVGLEGSTGYFTVRGAANYVRIHCG